MHDNATCHVYYVCPVCRVSPAFASYKCTALKCNYGVLQFVAFKPF